MLTVSEKITIIAKRKGITKTMLAESTGQSRQNLSNKIGRNNYTLAQLQDIAQALGCSVDVVFTDNETGETV